MDMREQEKEVMMPAASGGGVGYAHIFGETSSGVVDRRIESVHNGSHHHIQPENLDADLVAGEDVSGGGGGGGGGCGGGGGGRSKVRGAGTGVRYRECLKNHAASVGGNIYDGCGEFMPSGEDGTLEALKCAACECHRNFHRKEIDGENQLSIGANYRRGLMLPHLQLPAPLPSPSALHGHHKFSMALNLHSSPTAPIIAPMNVAYAGGGGTDSSSEDLNVFQSNAEVMPPSSYTLSKKRFRTKFTQDQKDRMLEFAEKIGWRIQKQDEEEVERFCSEVGVKRQVLKVWMHNNKNTMKKQNDNNEPELAIAVTVAGAGSSAAMMSES
ncbi:zinc-finger homeodomain protein 2-like [Cucurbita maxima]|uniref:Zinc-finger homeodomain protein 2-like n=1 Tax=Cucurbita maxima TaxID=3661 RepID=A0A6J1KJH0_CUCMA|nr:zinc-finger homeodomain protein 2-like [Cucurbita maxima]